MTHRPSPARLSRTNQSQSFLLLYRAVRNRPENVRIETCVASQLLGIDLIALAITVRYGSQLADVGHDHLVPELLELFADPDRMNARLHGNTCRRQARKPLPDRLRGGPEAASVDHFAVLVESAVMAPDITKADANRQISPSPPAGTSAMR
jgi:hypothetical protein